LKRGFFILIVLITCSSCGNKRSDTKYYYALDSLLNEQTKFLSETKAKLTKTAQIDGQEETKSYIPKSDTAWRYELDVFAALNDINKPGSVGKYKTQQNVKDVKSNLLVYSIESTEKMPVMFLKVYYLETLSNIRRIEGLYQEENSLLKNSRQLSMEFQNINNKIILTSYSVTGDQKMILGDTVRFSVNGMVTIP